MLRWTARVRCNENEIEYSFSVFIFIGDVPANPSKWSRSPTYAGQFDVYSGDQKEEHQVQGFVALNDKLLENSDLRSASLKPEVVVPYLKEKINWGVLGILDQEKELTSLEVVVLATTPPRGSETPTTVPYREITYGRTGGSRDP